MRYFKPLLMLAIAGVMLLGCKTTEVAQGANGEAWKSELKSNLAVLGARNWIVIAESSFPSYTGSGVTTVSTEQSSPTVFLEVLDLLERGGYVKPRIMVCSELRGVSEEYAPGVKRYKAQVNKLLPGRMHFELPNRIINGLIEDAIKQYKVLVIKTSTALPYSNIFIELDSGYWNSESETVLRTTLEEQQAKPVRQQGGQGTQSGGTGQNTEPSIDQLPQLPRENNGGGSAPSSPASNGGNQKGETAPGTINVPASAVA